MSAPNDESTEMSTIRVREKKSIASGSDHTAKYEELSPDDETKYPGPAAVALLMVAISFAIFLVSLVSSYFPFELSSPSLTHS
jgi:hypothetical protein